MGEVMGCKHSLAGVEQQQPEGIKVVKAILQMNIMSYII